MTVRCVISGGQTGVERAGIDAAWELRLKTGGWAPLGWVAEDGVIPEAYCGAMWGTVPGGYARRTRQNVVEADGTLILARGPINGGTLLTEREAIATGAPVMVLELFDLDAPQPSVSLARERVHAWIDRNHIRTLNIAGPRESKAPGIQDQARRVLVWLLRETS